MVANDEEAPRDDAEQPDDAPSRTERTLLTAAGERWHEFRTGEWQFIRIDLSDAYAAVRRRSQALRRRRIITSVVAGLVLLAVFTVVGVYYVNTIPLPNALSLPATTTVYYSDGRTVLARLGSQSRTLVDLATLPTYIPEAVVAAEDPTFWYTSNTFISRQYARVATDIDSSTPVGKAKLIIMSWKLEDYYNKQQILDFYVNTVYFGRGAYGIEAAARAYFGKGASDLTVSEAIVLAGLISSPGDGRFDPTVRATTAQQRFTEVAQQMVVSGWLTQEMADSLRMPAVNSYDPGLFESDLDRPTGLVVAQVLAELRDAEPFRDKAPGYLENGGFAIVTTIDPRAQSLLEQTADETIAGSIMYGQPDNLQAAAAVVEPGTGRVLAYFGGHDGTGADFAGSYRSANGTVVGFGAHPPGQTIDVYTLAAALKAHISVKSTWNSPSEKQFAGRATPVRDFAGAPCQPACSLVDATTGSLNVPFYALTQKIGATAVVDAAQAAGIRAMWLPGTPQRPPQRIDLPSSQSFGSEVGLGEYPVTVLDQANAMATFAAGGVRHSAHFVRRVTKDSATLYTETAGEGERFLDQAAADDLSWTLSQSPSAKLPDGRSSAAKTGVGLLRDSQIETAHAWIVGYTTQLAMAVWVGNEEMEFPLKDTQGARVTGASLPAGIYRTFMSGAPERLGLSATPFAPPTFTGDANAGDALTAG
jgi:membrane peptidoglycan carboxypeptidase